MEIKKVTIDAAFKKCNAYWEPKIIAELNGQMVKIARLHGEFVWHSHEHEDELFLVLEGELKIELRDRKSITLHPGECVVIPRMVEHRPVAKTEVRLLLFEPSSTVNTGDVTNDRTLTDLERLE